MDKDKKLKSEWKSSPDNKRFFLKRWVLRPDLEALNVNRGRREFKR